MPYLARMACLAALLTGLAYADADLPNTTAGYNRIQLAAEARRDVPNDTLNATLFSFLQVRDVQQRRFFLLGQTFNAQDLWLVLLLTLGFTFALLFVTAAYGRVWCGFACPQTVFLEGVYRPIEVFIEGSREKRIKLDAAPWSFDKLWRRVVKNVVFFIVSVIIAHTATAIFVSPRELYLMILEGPSRHVEAFGLTAGFTALLTFNFAWFREQFCVVR